MTLKVLSNDNSNGVESIERGGLKRLKQQPLKTTIVGASISGLTLALALVKDHGTSPNDITILESRSATSHPGGPIALTPNSLHLLEAMGLYDKVRKNGFNFKRAYYKGSNGSVRGDMPWGLADRWGYDALRIERAVLLSVLRSEAEKWGIQVEYDTKLLRVVSESDAGVIFEVLKGDEQAARKMSSDIIVGCDGLHSKTRGFVLGPNNVEPIFSGQVVVAARARASKLSYTNGFEPGDTGYHHWGVVTTAAGNVSMTPTDFGGDDVAWGRAYALAPRSRSDWIKFDANKQNLHNMLTEGIENMPEFVQSIVMQGKPEDAYIWVIHVLPDLKQWVSDGHKAIIIGDAAHTLNPVVGQGANQAIEDAYSLANVLGMHGAARESLDRWQAARMATIVKVNKLCRQLINARLPAEQRAKLAKDEVFDLERSQDEKDGQFDWLYRQDASGFLKTCLA